MDRFDEIGQLLSSEHGIDLEKALKIKNANTIIVQVGGGREYVTIEGLALNEDGTDRYDVSELQGLIKEYFPSAITTVAQARAQCRYVIEMGNE